MLNYHQHRINGMVMNLKIVQYLNVVKKLPDDANRIDCLVIQVFAEIDFPSYKLVHF